MELLQSIDSDQGFLFVLIRSVLIYIHGIILFRVGNNRFRFQSPFDFVIIVILGAIFGKIIFDGPLLLAIVISTFLIILHKILSTLSFKYGYFQFLIKGEPKILIQNGKINWIEMKKNGITKIDLKEMCHQKLQSENLSKIKKAILERNGDISFLT